MIDGILDGIKSFFVELLDNYVWKLFYAIEVLILKFVAISEQILMIFTGERLVDYNGDSTALINVFFDNSSVRGIYAGVALIGIVFAFIFAIWAVIRKALDIRGKQQGVTMGTILGNLLKSVLLIASMSFIMMVALETTNVLIRQVTYSIQNGNRFTMGPDEHEFTSEEFAAMGRIINTIGNFSLNPSYRSRYNLNACYNAIRPDLQFLSRSGVFDYHYTILDENGRKIDTWQSIMEELAIAANYNVETTLDTYDEGITNAVLDAMEKLQSNSKIEALPRINRAEIDEELDDDEPIAMDRILFLVGTMGTTGNLAAARNDLYNVNPSFSDAVRLPYYIGEKDIYDFDEVRKTFTPDPFHMNYAIVYIVGLALLREMIIMMITCAARIFQLLALYIASPLAIATMPLDDGGKFKQWSTAFIVQLLSIVGMVLSLRLFIMFLPLIWSPTITFSSSGAGNVLIGMIVRCILTYGAMEAVNKINGVFTGILADNAGYQAITASSMRDDVNRSALGKGLKAITAGGIAGSVGGGVWNKVRGKNWDGSKHEDTAVEKHEKSRKNDRDKANLKADIQYAKDNNKHMDGSALKEGELDRMQSTLKHMEAGNSLKDATQMAGIDAREDKKDRDAENKRKIQLSKNPPPKRNNGNEDLPNREG